MYVDIKEKIHEVVDNKTVAFYLILAIILCASNAHIPQEYKRDS